MFCFRDNDNITNIYNWYENNQPLTVLNMPFESNANDYSGYNNGTIYGANLPVRIGFWFMNESNKSCYSQGILPAGVTVIEPYCNPLMTQALGPMGGTINFRVHLRPNLTAGTYNVNATAKNETLTDSRNLTITV